MSNAEVASIIIAGCALVVSALSYRAARQLARESGWRITADRNVWFAGTISDESSDLAVTIRNSGRAPVEIVNVRVIFRRNSPFRNYGYDVSQMIEGGRSWIVSAERLLGDDGRSVAPRNRQFGLLCIKLGTGRTVRRWVRMEYL